MSDLLQIIEILNDGMYYWYYRWLLLANNYEKKEWNERFEIWLFWNKSEWNGMFNTDMIDLFFGIVHV